MDLRTFVQTVGARTCCERFFFRPSVSCCGCCRFRSSCRPCGKHPRPPAADPAAQPRRSLPWLVAFGLAAALIAGVRTELCRAGDVGGSRRWVDLPRGGSSPLGAAGAVLLLVARASFTAALLAASGGAAGAAWIIWLRGHLCGTEPRPVCGIDRPVFGLMTTVLILRRARARDICFG